MSAAAHPVMSARDSADLPLLLPGTVGFYFAARLCITFLFFQSDPKTGTIVNFGLTLSLLAAVMFYSLGGGPSTRIATLRVPPFRWVMGFLGVACCSLLWSATTSLWIASGYWSELAAQVAMIVLLLRAGSVARLSSAVLKGYVAGACVIALIAWFSPTMQDLRPGNDEFFSPNAIGFTCAFGVYLTQYLSRLAGVWSIGGRIAAAFLALTLLRSLSKTTIAAFVAGQIFLLARDKDMSRKSKVLLIIVTLVVFLGFSGLIESYFAVYSNTGNQAETLTGRIGIWAFVLGRSLEQPWIGHGFHSFRNVIPPFGSFEAWHAHNEILQQFYTYGAIGVLLLAGVYGSFFRYARRFSPPATRKLLASLLLFILIRGLADTENFDLSLPLWFLSLMSLTFAQSAAFPGADESPSISGGRPGSLLGLGRDLPQGGLLR